MNETKKNDLDEKAKQIVITNIIDNAVNLDEKSLKDLLKYVKKVFKKKTNNNTY